jgi:hypothetical protein
MVRGRAATVGTLIRNDAAAARGWTSDRDRPIGAGGRDGGVTAAQWRQGGGAAAARRRSAAPVAGRGIAAGAVARPPGGEFWHEV